MKNEQNIAPIPPSITYNEIIHTNEKIVSCEGNGPIHGHPKVYLKFKTNQLICPYCSKAFIYTSQQPS